MESLANKFSDILRWERRKRREQTLAIIACVTLALAILFLPVNGFLPRDWLRWTVPAILFMVAPGAYKDVTQVVEAAHEAGLASTVARLEPLICIKG
jgi:hypothetical protein